MWIAGLRWLLLALPLALILVFAVVLGLTAFQPNWTPDAQALKDAPTIAGLTGEGCSEFTEKLRFRYSDEIAAILEKDLLEQKFVHPHYRSNSDQSSKMMMRHFKNPGRSGGNDGVLYVVRWQVNGDGGIRNISGCIEHTARKSK